jgi:uncharacterized protein (TIGR03118 family)
MKKLLRAALLSALAAFLVQSFTPTMVWAAFIQQNLVSDIPGLAAITDANLKNPWGLSHTPTSPFWVSDQSANVATLYNVPTGGAVTKNALIVTMPLTALGAQGPTGQVFNSTSSFPVNGTPATFIFANLNGTIDAWNNSAGTNAITGAAVPGAVYTGLALLPSGPFLLAANNATGGIDVFNGTFQKVSLPGSFTDPSVPSGFGAFNVQVIDNKVYVTYAPTGHPAQTGALPGQGFIGVFDLNGNFLQHIADGHLASPWGLTLAPAGFGPFGNDLLVGNFSFLLSEINAFDPGTGAFLGTIPIDTGGNAPGGLWGLAFGNANKN